MGKIIITGPGRSGTTFLVQLLTRLGFDTGFEPDTEPYVNEIRAGCEWKLHFNADIDPHDAIKDRIAAAPRVLKSPEWGMVIKYLLSHGLIEIDHVLLPIRDLDTAARSRLDAGLDWLLMPDVEGDERVIEQANLLGLALGRAVEACVLFEVPCTILRFPSLVADPAYCYHKLKPLLDHSYEDFLPIWESLSRPQQIQTA